MNKLKRKISALLLAFVMVLGVVAPSLSLAVGDTSTNVVIHKIKLEEVDTWKKNIANKDGTWSGLGGNAYNGSQLNIEEYFGTQAEGLKGVSFTYWKVTEDQYKTLLNEANKDRTNTKDGVEALITDLEGKSKRTVETNDSGEVEVGPLEDGYYWFIENPDTNLKDGATVSDSVAVPFGLALPVWKADGSRFTDQDKLHVYPKNTITNKPDVTKEIEGNNENKNPKDYTVGSKIPYLITTTVKKGAQYKTAEWYDQMTEGLTFDQAALDAMEIKIDGIDLETNEYSKELKGNGFKVALTEDGLKKINGQNKDIVVTLKYKATLNEKALVEIPESNDVTFHYGNNPNHGNTPIPTKPNEEKITVNKTWASGIQLPQDGIEVEFTLYNAQTGEVVTFSDRQENPKKIKAENTSEITHTWTGLDNDTQYKVVETAINGYSAEYIKVDENGKITIKNHKDGNPPPQIPPETPKVVTGGKRFQKVDPKLENGKQGLKGAEFLVKNKEGKWLKAKDPSQLDADQKAYQEAEKSYQDAVKTSASDKDAKKLARDKAYRNVKTTWEWITAGTKETAEQSGAYKVTSDIDGYFKVTGLAYGKYDLVEFKAPEGYALLTDPIEFEVKEGSLNDTDEIMQKVVNKKITIPQTGGIGTIIFTVIGLAVMGGALVAMKKRELTESK